MFQLTLTQPPSTNKLRQAFIADGKVRQSRTTEYNQWIALAKGEALLSKFRKMSPPPYEISIGVGKCNRARDLDNFQKAAIDFLVNSGFIEKDSLMQVLKINAEAKFGIVPDGKIVIDVDYYFG